MDVKYKTAKLSVEWVLINNLTYRDQTGKVPQRVEEYKIKNLNI